MNKYATPQVVTYEDGEQVVSSQPRQGCCEATRAQLEKRASASGQSAQMNCQCGNLIEVTEAD